MQDATSQTNIALEQLHSTTLSRLTTREEGDVSDRPEIQIQSLHPVDGGRRAWLYLFGAFLMETIYWGFLFSFGIFQNYLTNHPIFEGGGSSIIGPVGTGIMYLEAPLVIRYLHRFPKHRTPMMYFGMSLSSMACLLASFSTKIWHLILTQGLMYGIGSGLVYFAAFSYLNEWFVRKRGLATGVLFGGAGIGGVILPFFFEWALTAFGYQTTLRVWAGLLTLISAPVSFFLIKGRLPVSQIVVATRLDLSFFKSTLFQFLAISNFMQGLGFFIPGIYLPSYASDLSMTAVQSTLVLSLFNLASVFGQGFSGYLSDKWGSGPPLFWSTAGGAVSVCLLWGFSKSFGVLGAFSLLFGLSAGGYSALWSRFAMDISADDPIMQLTIYGVFMFQRGIGNVIAGPISAILLGSKKQLTSYAIGKYEGMVLFTGITMAVSSLTVLGRLRFARGHRSI